MAARRVGVPGSDLGVAQVDAGVEHGGDEGVPEHAEVHPRAAPVAQQRPGVAVGGGAVDGAGHRRRKRHQNDLAAFADRP
jgi:hypothetical protein